MLQCIVEHGDIIISLDYNYLCTVYFAISDCELFESRDRSSLCGSEGRAQHVTPLLCLTST